MCLCVCGKTEEIVLERLRFSWIECGGDFVHMAARDESMAESNRVDTRQQGMDRCWRNRVLMSRARCTHGSRRTDGRWRCFLLLRIRNVVDIASFHGLNRALIDGISTSCEGLMALLIFRVIFSEPRPRSCGFRPQRVRFLVAGSIHHCIRGK